MQVERCFRGAGQKEKRLLAKGSLSRPGGGNSWEQSGERVRNAWESAEQFGPKSWRKLKSAVWWACVVLGSWSGKGWPSQWCLAGLFGWSATLGLRHGPDSHGGQQWGILDNGRKPDPAISREWRRAMPLVKLFRRVRDHDRTRGRSPG